MDLTFTVTEQPEWRTITGIQSPVQLASLDDWAGSADPAVVADPARVADSAEAGLRVHGRVELEHGADCSL